LKEKKILVAEEETKERKVPIDVVHSRKEEEERGRKRRK